MKKPVWIWIIINFQSCMIVWSTSTLRQNSINDNMMKKGKAYFTETWLNATVPVGRIAVFQCVVENLYDHQVAWIRKDKHTLLAVQDKVISQNNRIKVNRNDRSFNLHIIDVREEDRGEYMCQVNSEPMISQSGFLQVTVPPSFISNLTSSDTEVFEGDSVSLRCTAKGFPIPEIQWRREDKEPINAQSSGFTNKNKKVKIIYGEYLNISKATREDMGAYLCIASNGIQPSTSKRIFLATNFAPLILTPFHRVTAALGGQVTLTCNVEAYPYADSYWMISSTKQIIVSNSKHKSEVERLENGKGNYKYVMKLTVKELQLVDFTKYTCVAKNIYNQTSSQILLTEDFRTSIKKADGKPFYIKNEVKSRKNQTKSKTLSNYDNLKERINIASLLTNSHKNNKLYESMNQAKSEEDTSYPQPTDFKESLIKADQEPTRRH